MTWGCSKEEEDNIVIPIYSLQAQKWRNPEEDEEEETELHLTPNHQLPLSEVKIKVADFTAS